MAGTCSKEPFAKMNFYWLFTYELILQCGNGRFLHPFGLLLTGKPHDGPRDVGFRSISPKAAHISTIDARKLARTKYRERQLGDADKLHNACLEEETLARDVWSLAGGNDSVRSIYKEQARMWVCLYEMMAAFLARSSSSATYHPYMHVLKHNKLWSAVCHCLRKSPHSTWSYLSLDIDELDFCCR